MWKTPGVAITRMNTAPSESRVCATKLLTPRLFRPVPQAGIERANLGTAIERAVRVASVLFARVKPRQNSWLTRLDKKLPLVEHRLSS